MLYITITKTDKKPVLVLVWNGLVLLILYCSLGGKCSGFYLSDEQFVHSQRFEHCWLNITVWIGLGFWGFVAKETIVMTGFSLVHIGWKCLSQYLAHCSTSFKCSPATCFFC
jgi:hypothetical protein